MSFKSVDPRLTFSDFDKVLIESDILFHINALQLEQLELQWGVHKEFFARVNDLLSLNKISIYIKGMSCVI